MIRKVDCKLNNMFSGCLLAKKLRNKIYFDQHHLQIPILSNSVILPYTYRQTYKPKLNNISKY